MANSTDFEKAVELIEKSSNVLITTHTRPDGDACGSVVAMVDALTGLGKKVYTVFLSEVPDWYEFLFEQKPAILGKDVKLEQLKQGGFGGFDMILLIDVNSDNQLPVFCEYLKQNDKPVLVIDHHITNDGLGDVELIDTEAAATGMIILDLLKHADWPVTEKIARALFVAIAIDVGASPPQIHHDLYQNFSHERFKLMTAMLNTLELHLDARYATQHLLASDFERAGASHKDTENLIDECRKIGSVEAAAMFVELDDGRVKCSLRSSGSVDVRKIAQRFGGGGHTAASGAYLPGPLKNAKQLVFDAVKEQFAEIDAK
jgi:phosphoesterase RecJ-like protein